MKFSELGLSEKVLQAVTASGYDTPTPIQAEAVPVLNLDAQELQVGSLLSSRGLRLVNATAEARRTCDMDRGWAGQRPLYVLRYETGDLRHLPDELDQRLQAVKFKGAAVGACDAGGSGGAFARFRIAILLF